MRINQNDNTGKKLKGNNMIGMLKYDGKFHRNMKLSLEGDTKTAFFQSVSEDNEEDFLTLISVKVDFFDRHLEFRGISFNKREKCDHRPSTGRLYIRVY